MWCNKESTQILLSHHSHGCTHLTGWISQYQNAEFSEYGGPNYTKFGGYIEQSSAFYFAHVLYRFSTTTSHDNTSKMIGIKNRGQILHFFTPVKIKRRVGKMSQSGFQAQSRTQPLIYFWWRAAACARRLNTIYRPVFHRGTIAMMNSLNWGSDLSQVWWGDKAMIAASKDCFVL